MATAPVLITEDAYLQTAYRPDCDYVDGAVLERNLGQFEHSTLQMLVLMALQAHAVEWKVLVRPELRLKIRPGKYRIPDIMVLPAGVKHPPVIDQAPLLCIEIVSPDDRMRDLIERCRDYLSLGVPETWILDPAEKQAYVFSSAGLHQVNQLALGELTLDISSIFAHV